MMNAIKTYPMFIPASNRLFDEAEQTIVGKWSTFGQKIPAQISVTTLQEISIPVRIGIS